jgi:pilus assembly protein CpaE
VLGRKTRILIVDDEESCSLTLRYHLQDEFEVMGVATSGEDAIAQCRISLPDIILMDFDMPGMGGVAATTIITDLFPNVITVMQLKEEDLVSAHKAMTAGARDFFKKPVKRDELLDVVRRTAIRQRERRALLKDRTDVPGAGIWSFANGNGGIGQTSLIVSIASELQYLEKRVVIVDMNMLFGDVLLQLNLTSGNANLATLLSTEGPYTLEMIEENLCTHSSGIKVLAPPTDSFLAAGIEPLKLTKLVLKMESYFDYILLDLPTGINDHYVEIMDNSRFVFLTSSGSLGGIKNLRILLKIFQEFKYPATKIRPVLLQSEEECAPFEQLNTLLTKVGSQFAHAFPHDSEMAKQAISAGQPITRYAPKSAYTHVLREFLIPLLHLPPITKAPARTGSFLQRLFR